MARMAVLVPYQELCNMVEAMFEKHHSTTRHSVEAIPNARVEERVRELETEGCDIIMARGLQARIARLKSRLPVVEIRMTTQELVKLAIDIRAELGIPKPRIAVVGGENMLCQTSSFEHLFGISISRYIAQGTQDDAVDEPRRLVREALADGCQAVIGGRVACDEAEKCGLCHRFAYAGEESLQLAFDMAQHVAYAIDLEKASQAELETILNFTSGGIVRINTQGVVLWASKLAFDLLSTSEERLLHRQLTDVFPTLGAEYLDRALIGGEEVYATMIPPNRTEIVVNIVPVRVDGIITGAILTLHEGRRIMEMNTELRQELYAQGYLAVWHFEDLPAESDETKQMFRKARLVAEYRAPVLLQGPVGSGKEFLAQCIHNAGVTRSNAFIPLDCSAYQPDTLDTMLFGNYSLRKDTPASLVEIAQNGTLYMAHIEALSPELQYKIMQLTRGYFMHNGSNRAIKVNVRLITSTNANLIAMVEKCKFRSDLYYSLNALGIELCPLSRRREDILGWIELFLSLWEKRYDRRVHLTQNARGFLERYDWPGNINEIYSVCEQIVLLSKSRSIDESFLRRHIQQLTPRLLPGTEQQVVYKDEKAVRIAALLREYNGNRQKVADALGVSKTTLWRYMNKYGIDKNFSY